MNLKGKIMKNHKTLIASALTLSFALASGASLARPVSYPGGWTSMIMNNEDEASLHLHYSPTATYSVGYKGIYMKDKDMSLHAVQLNNLIKRWNMPAAQANIYLKSGIGFGANEDTSRAAAFTGLAADIEDRRFFASYENNVISAGNLDKGFTQHIRLGVAPYIGDYGDLHTWIMLQGEHHPGEENTFDARPILRFFKGFDLLEVGTSVKEGGLTLNYIHRF